MSNFAAETERNPNDILKLKIKQIMKKFSFFVATAALSLLNIMPMSAQKKAAVFITAGQSNADGRAWVNTLPDYLKSEPEYLNYANVTSTRTGKFGARDITSGNRWAFCDVVNYYLNNCIGEEFYSVKCTYGGTAIALGQTATKLPMWYADSTWLSENTAYEKIVNDTAVGKSLSLSLTDGLRMLIDSTLSKLSQGYDVKAIMWHQGESDRKASEAYYDNFKTLIQYFRKSIFEMTGDSADLTLPFIFGTVSHNSKQYSSGVEAAQWQVAKDLENVYGIDLSDAELMSDNLHFGAEWTEYIGKAMYNLMCEKGILDCDPVENEKPATEESAMDTITVAAERNWDFTQAWSQASKDSIEADSKWVTRSGWGYRYANTQTTAAELQTSTGYVFPESSGLYFKMTSGNRATINPGSNIGMYSSNIWMTIPKVKPGQYIYIKTSTANSASERGIVPDATSANNLDSIAGGYKSKKTVENVWWVQDTFTDPVDATFTCSGGGIYIYHIMITDSDPLSSSTGIRSKSLKAVRSEKTYNLMGQEVSEMKNGIYISDGRKVLVSQR